MLPNNIFLDKCIQAIVLVCMGSLYLQISLKSEACTDLKMDAKNNRS